MITFWYFIWQAWLLDWVSVLLPRSQKDNLALARQVRDRETVCVAACNQVKDEFNDGAVFHSPSCNIIMVPNYMIVLPSWKEGTGDDDDEEHCYGVKRGGMGRGGGVGTP